MTSGVAVPANAGSAASGVAPFRCRRALAAAVLAAVLAACATKVPPPVEPPKPTYVQKLAAIVHLEDRRVLVDADLPPPASTALADLVADAEGRVRRRAALAIGRSGAREGSALLVAVLAKDTEPDVRAMAAFALGVLGDAATAPALMTALGDADARVQGRAAEALGLLGYAPAANGIATMAGAHVSAGVLAALDSDDQTYPLTPQVEAARLGIYALVRLSSFEALRRVTLKADGTPVSDWWPLAYAMQRIGHQDAAPVLRGWLSRGGALTRAFALRGLGGLKDQASRPSIEALAADTRQPIAIRVQSVRALGAIADRRSAVVLTALLKPPVAGLLRLEAMTALGAIGGGSTAEAVIDYLEDQWPPLRAAAQATMARSDAESFMTVLSGFDRDGDWSVRASLATTLGGLSAEAATPRLEQLVRDDDPKVVAAALRALTRVKGPGLERRLVTGLAHADPVVRMAAAEGIGTTKPAGAVAALTRAIEASRTDTTYVARAAMLAALAAVDRAAATPVLTAALNDANWAIRVRAATLLAEGDPASAQSAARPAPAPAEAALDAVDLSPAYSPDAYIQTNKGEIRIELAVLDAPRTVANFVALARKGFFDGVRLHRVVPDFVVQDGDPRGDGEGGPGYTIRDEINDRPYLRGTVGMALDWKDTGGSQFFITHSPQPHLDARYTVFGRVLRGWTWSTASNRGTSSSGFGSGTAGRG